jgi:hypothetical protein
MSNIVVVGVVRDSGHRLAMELEIVTLAFKNHTIKKIIIIESDSTDNTDESLARLQKESDKYLFKSLGKLSQRMPKRTERLAYCRNRYLEICEDNDFFGAEFLYVTDWDGVNTNLSSSDMDSVLINLSSNFGFAATANQLYKYYDIWALRHPIWSPNDCWASYHKMAPLVGDIAAREICNVSRMIHISKELPPIEVDSAFGGGALYPTKFLSGCRYDGLTSEGNEVCEHISFSTMFKMNGGKLAIYPNFINSDKSIHVEFAEEYQRKGNINEHSC